MKELVFFFKGKQWELLVKHKVMYKILAATIWIAFIHLVAVSNKVIIQNDYPKNNRQTRFP